MSENTNDQGRKPSLGKQLVDALKEANQKPDVTPRLAKDNKSKGDVMDKLGAPREWTLEIDHIGWWTVVRFPDGYKIPNSADVRVVEHSAYAALAKELEILKFEKAYNWEGAGKRKR